jgi:hypothetical protein
MKLVNAQKLVDFVARIMRSAGSHPDEASTIARRLVDSNLVGHDSHGVLRVAKYLEWVRDGTLKPNMSPSIVFENDTVAIIDGQRGFGQVIGEFAARTGITKAARTGIAMVGLTNCGHLGRVGDWADMAADAGQVSLHFLNTSGALRAAPFGGTDRRLSTNPISIGVPVAGRDPVVLDVTTSMVAEGKLMVAMNKGEQVPTGWIIDKEGAPTTEPKDFYAGGALLTVGGHKGLRTLHRDGPARRRGVDDSRSDPTTRSCATTCCRLHRAGRLRSRGRVAREARRSSISLRHRRRRIRGPCRARGIERRNSAARRRCADRRQDVRGPRGGRGIGGDRREGSRTR